MYLTAAKLKKEWIEKAKVKKQWKHQKRKGDVDVAPVQRDLPPHLVKDIRGSGRVASKEDVGGQPEYEPPAAKEAEGVAESTEMKDSRG